MTAASPTPAPQARVPPWRDIRVLRAVAQLAALGLVLLFAAWLLLNLGDNMRQSRLSFGFGFLNSTAGFDIGETLFAYSATDTYLRAFLVGLA
ncbi:MAG TPA: hypothetical protein VNT28_01040, partial [Candidatus Limnocylindrales bacterium]|nr:hypothetical protein [Candidatus Limnocylindrales bacterium]